MKRKSTFAAAEFFRRTISTLALMVLLPGFMFLEAALAPKAELWPRWQTHDATSTNRIKHDEWDGFLKTYVRTARDGIHRVAYRHVTREDKQALGGYVDRLGRTNIDRFNRAEQLAYWINFYNALTVRLVLRHYPVESIRDIDISSGFLGGPWNAKVVEVMGEPMSLNDIEHRILRPVWRDPRIHYAVNCASFGCPNLLAVAFTGENTQSLLEQAARAYINHPRGVRVSEGTVTASKIYAWFQEDFGGSEAGVLRHLRRFAEPSLAKALEGYDAIDDYEYDWGLNDSAS